MPTDRFDSALEAWIDVSMRRSMRNFLRYARQSGLSLSHIGALFHIHREGRCGVSELGNHLGVTSAAASQMLERLVQQELILRTEDPSDRRVKQIVLTEKGSRILQDGIRARQSWIVDLTETLNDAEKETIKVALDILIDKITNLQQPLETETKVND
jgi:DNA-binding MarR family transcriptional regulator